MPILDVRNLSKVFDGAVAVDNISFSIEESRITGLLGPNGAGKTTIIYMLLGLVTPTAGSISIFGKPVSKHRQELLSRMNFSSAYVSLPSNLKVMENLSFFSKLYNVTSWKQRTDYLLEIFGLQAVKEQKTGELSSGQLTRLNLVKALLNNPSFLLLDEPTASLDPVSARIVRERLREISQKDKVTIFYTSHNMREVEELCDEVVFLHKGKIKAMTTPGELMQSLKRDNMEEVFFELIEDKNGGD